MDRSEYLNDYRKRTGKKKALLDRIRRKAKKQGKKFALRLEHITEDTIDIRAVGLFDFVPNGFCQRVLSNGRTEIIADSKKLSESDSFEQNSTVTQESLVQDLQTQ